MRWLEYGGQTLIAIAEKSNPAKRNLSADKKLPARINQEHIRPVPESHIACYTYKIRLNLGNLKKEEEKKEVAGYPENPEKERRKQRKLKTILLIR